MWKSTKAGSCDLAAEGRGSQSTRHEWDGWKWFQATLLTSGLSLLAIYGAVRLEGYLSSRAALQSFSAVESSAPSASRSLEEDNGSQETNFAGWNDKRIAAYKEMFSSQFGAPMAVLQIPKIHLTVPLLDGTDDLTLNHAVGHIAGTSWPGEQGNIGIAGHRDGFFRGLEEVSVGDEINLRTWDRTDEYVVNEIRI